MIGLEWNQLRSFNGDVKNAFEELVCQLARAEQDLKRIQFLRVAAPDGGVEAYSIQRDCSEHGWQAKFFLAMDDSQWKQLDESFKTAFEKHPALTKYYICIPLDREDPRITIQKGKRTGQRVQHFMDKWNAKVKEWQAFAAQKSRSVDFEYWGNSEIFDRLSKKEHAGRRHYWFNQTEFTDDWFQKRLDENIRNLGKRYTPEINFELPIVRYFKGLAKDNSFKNTLISQLDAFLKAYNKSTPKNRQEQFKDLLSGISRDVVQFRKTIEEIKITEAQPIGVSQLVSSLESITTQTGELVQKLYEFDEEQKVKLGKEYDSNRNTASSEIRYIRDFEEELREFQELMESPLIQLASCPAMLLVGDAGAGKSHLLADIALQRQRKSQPTILLLGQHFNHSEPWDQIRKQLHVSCDRDTFLSALNAIGEFSDGRVLILIDALNEGEGKKLWKDQLAGFVHVIKNYPCIGLVLSVRESYEKLLIPESMVDEKQLIRVEHTGFSGLEYEASKRFFEYYQIQQPSIPLLHPEFSNPLFLKLFCEGLHKSGLHAIPPGYEGLSAIIEFYLGAINKTLSEKHSVRENRKLIHKIARRIAAESIQQHDLHMKLDDAYLVVTNYARENSITDANAFYFDLISEGLITENHYWPHSEDDYEGVYISYERFGDHLACTFLLDTYLKQGEENTLFCDGSPLHYICNDGRSCYFNKGLIEALSIQLPERIGKELFELVPHAKEFDTISEAFIDSLHWRKRESIHFDQIESYINEHITVNKELHNQFVDTLLLTASQPNHPFNSDFLHKHLMEFSMADRDAWWTPYIHRQYPNYGEASPLKRMIDWCWCDHDRRHVSDESLRLMCQAMIWFLTSTNRAVRDCSTKALISVLENRAPVLISLINAFHGVNDRYVLQRLYAVAYGCSVRTSDTQSLNALAQKVFEKVFDTEFVVPDILLRDYARGVIEFAVHRGHSFAFNLSRIRPPYKSTLPDSFPTNEDVDALIKFDYKGKSVKDHQYSLNAIFSSMVTEHGRGTSRYGDFGRYIFDSAFYSWKIDTNELSNLALQWIVQDYGYDVDKHGHFDNSIRNYDRHSHNEERIGKKYQWIAFHDLLARVADKFPMSENRYDDNTPKIPYSGPWEPSVRDIDPTILIRKTHEDSKGLFWWNPVQYQSWEAPNSSWVFETSDLPKPGNLISLKDEQGQEWLNLKSFQTWSEKPEIGTDKWDRPHKELWYMIKSFVIHKKDKGKLTRWAKQKNFMGRWMPESRERTEVYSREYYWSPACLQSKPDDYPEYGWTVIEDDMTRRCVCKIAVTTAHYFWEETYDMSKESTISFLKPSQMLFHLLDMEYSKNEGELLNDQGERICFDPCTIHPTQSCLLVNKNLLLQKLQENDLELIWTVIGEKNIAGGAYHRRKFEGRTTISGLLHFDSELKSQLTFFHDQARDDL